ncbi:hypothetical protein B296_00001414 [Ensete ventricosum]|uniref:Uncharacterized protein n=1 Tax=Ensete ventricosum TaxID=4639 RepID=A0A427AMN2_ENSVE|nr:hypothetical protein B296_00001414 [Ensete ventricosum]
MVCLGRALARKFNSNSFANRSNEDIEAGLRREYQVLAATLRPSWRDSRGGCVSFRDLALWRLRLKRGLPVRGYRRLRLRKYRQGSRLVSCRMYELGSIWDYGLHYTGQCLDLASEAEKSLSRDDERSKVGRG